MHSEDTNVHEGALHLCIQADFSPGHTSTCPPRVGAEEKQQIRVRTGPVGRIGKGGKTGQRGKNQNEFGGRSLEQTEVHGLGWTVASSL